MNVTVIAHAGDLLASLIYMVPMLAIFALLLVTSIRDRRRNSDRESSKPTNERKP